MPSTKPFFHQLPAFPSSTPPDATIKKTVTVSVGLQKLKAQLLLLGRGGGQG